MYVKAHFKRLKGWIIKELQFANARELKQDEGCFTPNPQQEKYLVSFFYFNILIKYVVFLW